VICKHGIWDQIVTCGGPEFTSLFFNPVCSHLSINLKVSTTFHPQTDGQTEQPTQTIEQYLRAFSNHEQYNWVEQLPLADFPYNNSVDHSTQLTPFWTNFLYHPPMQFKATVSHIKSKVWNTAWLNGIGIGTDESPPPGELGGSPGTPINMRWRKGRDLRSQEQCVALDMTLLND